ncbi:HET-domain-containing protein [Mycena sanguinolenta]|uniref:HET-domain-containing protein n=1 Tax=Mycena sanguinolenta TaxID=230812 RepID=A0A8H7CHT5_9AGAR|nr:HET-domain-containing protein [Mycena sanguinolenta]
MVFEKIGTITQTIATGLLGLDDMHRTPAADALKRDLEKYNSVLVDAAHILEEWTSHSIIERVFKRGDFSSIADNLEKKIESFRDAFSVARLTTLSQGQDEIKAILTKLDNNNTRSKIKEWLKPPGVAANYQNASDKKHPGTGKWLLENCLEFREWIYVPMSFLWLHGISGSGKTVLSAMIIDKIQNFGVLYAFFYFDINHAEQQRVNNLLCSLVHQLSTQLFCPALSELWETCQKGEFLPTNAKLLPILEDFCRKKEVYLVVDALDECSERDMLLNLLASILEAKLPNMHLVVTSRTEVTHSEIAKEAVLLSLEKSVLSDIELYVGDQLSKMGGYIAKNKDTIRRELLDKGDGMFRLVALQLETLQKSGGTKSKVNQALGTMPTTLAGIYDHILKMTDIPEQVCQAMNWLIFGLRELTLGAIIDALAFDFSEDRLRFDEDERMEAQALLDACGSLVSVPQNWDNRSGSTKWGVQVSDQAAQNLIAKTCLAYFNSLDADLGIETAYQNYPLVEYASRHWDDHLKGCENFAEDSALCELFLEVLQENNPKYILFKNLLRYYSVRFDLGPPLCLLAYMGIQQGVDLVLKQGVNINVQGGRFGTALQAAAYRGNSDIMQLLLEHHADPSILGGEYSTALQAAAYQANIDIIRLLLEHNANVNLQGGEYGTALQAAAYRENIDIMQLLLEHHADPNILGGEYGTVLQAAAYGKAIDIVQLLIKCGTDINIQGGRFGTALQAAAAYGNIDIVKLLLEHTADVNLQGGEYGTALQAATHKENIDIMRLLLEHHADPNIPVGEYGTLPAAASKGHIDIMQLLLEHHADPNILGGEYGTALQAAAYRENIDIMQLLLEHNANVNLQGGEYGTPLQAAAFGDTINIVQLLINSGADINMQGGRFGTALQAAAAFGNIEHVKLLLEHGADVNLQGGEHGSALQAATERGHLDIVQLLQAHGTSL